MTPEAIETICRRATFIHARTLNDEAAELAKDILALCDHIAASENGEAAPVDLAGEPGPRQLCESCGIHEQAFLLKWKADDGRRYEVRACRGCATNSMDYEANLRELKKVFKVDRLLSCDPIAEQHRANDADPVYDRRFEGCLSV